MDKIYQKIQEKAQRWELDAIVQAVIDDDPEMKAHAEEFKESLAELQQGDFSRVRMTKIPVSTIVATRHQTNLSQPKFAEKLGISVNTLRSWEQGLRKPSGAAEKLLHLLHRRPELIHELQG